MRFPGSKLLSKNLSTKTTSFDDLVRHCENVNLSGYLEITFPDAEGILLFYLGEQINIIYRQSNRIFVSSEALLKLRNTAQLKEGATSIYELPLDMAHMLRGLSNRQEIFGQIFAAEPLKELIKKLKHEGHTGSLEILTNRGKGMILQVRGRFSNAYFEPEAGVTFEKGEAVNKIYSLLGLPDTTARVFKSDFSSDIWKARQHGGKARASRLHDILEQARPSDGHAEVDEEYDIQVAPEIRVIPSIDRSLDHESDRAVGERSPAEASRTDRRTLQKRILDDIREQAPSMLTAFFFDLATEDIDTKVIAVPDGTEKRLLVTKLPAFMKYLENLTAMAEDDHVESLSMTTENFYLIVKILPEVSEGMALVTDRSQPSTLATSLLLNSSHRYLTMLAGATI